MSNHPVFGAAAAYAPRWQSWVKDPLLERAGVTFDRTPAGPILAPAGQFRVCAYHLDFTERPTCWLDVPTLAQARFICGAMSEARGGWNVDFAVAYDDTGKLVVESSIG